MNPNETYVIPPGGEKKEGVPFCGDMSSHASFVWEHYVKASGIGKLLVIAHSAGGSCVGRIMNDHREHFFKAVQQLAYTDSWVMVPDSLSEEEQTFFEDRVIHYESSHEKLGKKLEKRRKSYLVVSAGHPDHVFSTGCAWPLIKEKFAKSK